MPLGLRPPAQEWMLGAAVGAVLLCAGLIARGPLVAGSAAPSSSTGPPSRARAQAAPGPAPAYPGIDTVTFIDGQHGWAAGPGVILATADGGRTWVRQYAGTSWVTQLDFIDAQRGWAVTDHGLLRTVDGGAAWDPVGPAWTPEELSPPLIVGDVDFVSATQGWGSGQDPPGSVRLIHTADGGQTWQPAAVPAAAGPLAPACFASAEDGWLGLGTTVYGTTDSGHTWLPAYTPPAPPQMPSGVQLECGPGWVWALFSAKLGVQDTAYLLVRGDEGGQAWSPVLGDWGGIDPDLPTVPQPFINGVSAVSADTIILMTVCGPCGFETTMVTSTSDGGRTWHSATVPGAWGGADIAFTDAAHGWLTLGGGEPPGRPILATADGGTTWREQYPPAPAPLLGVSFVGPAVGYGLGMPGDAGAVLRTSDGGASWRAVGRIPSAAAPPSAPEANVLSFPDPLDGWAVTTDGGLVRTADAGAQWAPVPLPGGQAALGVAFATRLAGCAVTPAGADLATRDAGGHWEPAAGGGGVVACAARQRSARWAAALATVPSDWTMLSLAGPTGGWAALRGRLEATADSGATWTPLAPAEPGIVLGDREYTVVGLSFSDPLHGWAVFGIDGTLLRTTDGGLSWGLVGG